MKKSCGEKWRSIGVGLQSLTLKVNIFFRIISTHCVVYLKHLLKENCQSAGHEKFHLNGQKFQHCNANVMEYKTCATDYMLY